MLLWRKGKPPGLCPEGTPLRQVQQCFPAFPPSVCLYHICGQDSDGIYIHVKNRYGPEAPQDCEVCLFGLPVAH